MKRRFAFAAVLLFTAAPARADFLRASRSAHVYAEPDRTSERLAMLEAGDEVELLSPDKQDGYYAVRSQGGQAGFVYKTLVRRFEGELPAEETGARALDPAPSAERIQPSARITAERVTLARQLDRPALVTGQYRVHLFDLGTGLSVLVQGADFTFLFDGGSSDDARSFSRNEGTSARLLAYLWGAVGPSGGERCVPEGESFEGEPNESRRIDHVVLSHPHQDHGSQLDEVLDCYRVEHVWEPGVVNDAAFYRRFIEAVAAEEGLAYHTVRAPAEDGVVTVGEATIAVPSTVRWMQFDDGEHQRLGAGAFFDVLFADGERHDDFNQNSLVFRVQLGDKSLLLMGDAEAGLGRGTVTERPGEAEAHLLREHPNAIDVDILQVGHHGSLTSSRREFLEAVSPEWALLSAGPKQFGSVTLPDQEVVAELERVLGKSTHLLRTDLHDARRLAEDDASRCEAIEKVGSDEDGRPGGCDGWVLDVR